MNRETLLILCILVFKSLGKAIFGLLYAYRRRNRRMDQMTTIGATNEYSYEHF